MGSFLETQVNDAILPRRIIAEVSVAGADAAAAANYPVFFIADSPAVSVDPGFSPTASVYEVVSVRERHETAGSDAGAVTVMVKKVPSGTAPASGTDVLAAGINLKATANTNQSPALHATAANRLLAPGDALALVTTGVLTAVAGVALMVELRRV
jgi:hypothetical protein